MKKWVFLLVFLGGCTTTESVGLPDGTTGIMVRCNGTAQSIADCQLKAGEICPQGYGVVSQNIENNQVLIADADSALSGNAAKRSMIIKCKP